MLLEQLSNAPGVSGDEAGVRDLILEAVRDRVDEYRVDSLGNLITCKRPSGRSPRRRPKVLIAAHMDEVGLMVVHADDNGRLRFAKVGAIDDRVLPGQVFLIGPDKVPGVIGLVPIHRTTPAERDKVIASSDLTLDIGAKSESEALAAVRLGQYAVFDTRFSGIGDGLVRGKALDDRSGCAMLVDILAGDYPFDLYGVFTVQEEIGTRGARVVAYSIEPDIAIVLESTVCDDSPRTKDLSPITRLGYGPALTIADRTTISDRRLVDLFIKSAREHNIPFQIKQPLIGGTDAGRLHLTREGVPSIAVSVPTRYIHSPAALASLQDFENASSLVQQTLPRLNRGLAGL